MKQGWIQVELNGRQEELAPKTMADMVYVDEGREKTVKEALAEGLVAVFEHTMSVVNGKRVHNFEGPSGFEGMGRAALRETIQAKDLVTVNGMTRDGYIGGVNLSGDVQFTLPNGSWVTFVVEEASVNFNVGGTDRNYQVIAVPSEAGLPAAVIENTFAVITSVPLGKISFQAREEFAVAPKDGDVWIRTNNTAALCVNMSKKDGLLVYVSDARQRIGGVWQVKELRLYQQGSWKRPFTYLYSNGILYKPVTPRLLTVEYNSDHLYGDRTATAADNKRLTWSDVNLSNISTVYAVVSTDSTGGTVRLGLGTSTTNIALTANKTKQLYALDVSNVSGISSVSLGATTSSAFRFWLYDLYMV